MVVVWARRSSVRIPCLIQMSKRPSPAARNDLGLPIPIMVCLHIHAGRHRGLHTVGS